MGPNGGEPILVDWWSTISAARFVPGLASAADTTPDSPAQLVRIDGESGRLSYGWQRTTGRMVVESNYPKCENALFAESCADS